MHLAKVATAHQGYLQILHAHVQLSSGLVQDEVTGLTHAQQSKLSAQMRSPVPSTSASAAQPLSRGMSHRSVFEIQPPLSSSSSSSKSDSPEKFQPSKLRWRSQALPAESSSGSLSTQSAKLPQPDEDGIELQEQGHAEMLEHALGEASSLRCNSLLVAFQTAMLNSISNGSGLLCQSTLMLK